MGKTHTWTVHAELDQERFAAFAKAANTKLENGIAVYYGYERMQIDTFIGTHYIKGDSAIEILLLLKHFFKTSVTLESESDIDEWEEAAALLKPDHPDFCWSPSLVHTSDETESE
jgi:hypothetical protein